MWRSIGESVSAVDGKPLEISKRKLREFKSLDTAAMFLFKIGVADFAVKMKTNAG